MDRRTFIKTAVAGGAFLPTFATLEPPPKKKGESDIRVAVLGYGVAGRILGLDLAQMPGVRVCAVCDIWAFNSRTGQSVFKS